MLATLRQHWPEVLIEAVLLGLFMLSASSFGLLLEHPGSPLRAVLVDPLVRRACMGCAMGLTALALIYSPLGKRSGAHMNPAVTLTFLRLGKVRASDAWLYVAAQFLGGAAGMVLASSIFGRPLADPHVTFEAPLSGMSMNPARSFGSALSAGAWMDFWVYLLAPLAGMSAAAFVTCRLRSAPAVHCAKLHHANPYRCIFCGANS